MGDKGMNSVRRNGERNRSFLDRVQEICYLPLEVIL